jgi:hypothetical protein
MEKRNTKINKARKTKFSADKKRAFMSCIKSNLGNEVFSRKPVVIARRLSKMVKRIRAGRPIVISAIIVKARVEKEIPIRIRIGTFTAKVFGMYE